MEKMEVETVNEAEIEEQVEAEAKEPEKKFSDLTFRQLMDFNFVPRYLLEQMKDKDYDVDRIYYYGQLFIRSPFNFLFAMTNKDYVIKGILWVTIDPVTELMGVNVFSVDKEYQSNGKESEARDISYKFLKEEFPQKYQQHLAAIGVNLRPTILGTTTRPEAWERSGFKRYHRVIMEG